MPAGLYFISDGQVELTHHLDQSTPILLLGKGCYFGDAGLLLDSNLLGVKYASV